MKILYKSFISAIALLVVLSSCASVSFASNNTDTVFSFYFIDTNLLSFQDPGRSKTDATGTYVSYTGGTATSANFVVYGGNQSNFSSCTSRYNETKNSKAYVPRYQTGCIRQYVYENRWSHYNMSVPYAFISGYVVQFPSGYSNTYASGVWSPDTVGTYQYFN